MSKASVFKVSFNYDFNYKKGNGAGITKLYLGTASIK